MGVFTASAQTVLDATPAEVYDFVSDPRNWTRTFRGSADIDTELTLPLQVGDVWSEAIAVGESFTCRSTWRLITAVRPWKFAYQQVNDIGAAADGTGGVDGVTTITYTITPGGDGTLFHRLLHCELPRGVTIPEPLLLARAQPAHIENFQEAVGREIAKTRAGTVSGG